MSLEITEAAAPAADNSPLTIDQAAALLYERKQKAAGEASRPRAADGKFAKTTTEAPEGEAPVEEVQESEAVTQTAGEAEGEPQEANPEGDDAGPPEPLEAAIEPPQFWDAEGKEAFAKLSPASQKEVLAYEKQRTAAVAKAMQKSTEAAKAFEAKHQQLREIVDRFGEQEEPADARMKQWDEWFAREGVELARTNPGAFVAEQARYQQEKREFDKVKADKADAERALYSEHIKEQNRLLPELAPELADPKEGKQRFADTMKYLRDAGYDSDTLKWISARDLSFAHKAMMYDRAQARAKQAPIPKPKQAGPTAAPAGQGQRASSSEQRLRTLDAKKSLTIEESIELRRLKRKP